MLEELRALLDGEGNARRALSRLRNRIAHQGYADEEAVGVVPHLVGLLPDEGVALLLADLAVGGNHLQLTRGYMEFDVIEHPRVRALRAAMEPAGDVLRARPPTEAASVLALALGPWNLDPRRVLEGHRRAGPWASNVIAVGLWAARTRQPLPAFDAERAARSPWVRGAVICAEWLAGTPSDPEPLIELVGAKPPPGLVADVPLVPALMHDAPLARIEHLIDHIEGPDRARVARAWVRAVLEPVDGLRLPDTLTRDQQAALRAMAKRKLTSWSEGWGIPTRDLKRYLSRGRGGPLDRRVGDRPLWHHLAEAVGDDSGWDAAVADLDGAARLALFRDAFSHTYRLWRVSVTEMRALEAAGEEGDRLVTLWVRTLRGVTGLDTYLEEHTRTAAREALIVLLALGGEPTRWPAAWLEDALNRYTIAPHAYRRLLARVPPERREEALAGAALNQCVLTADLVGDDTLESLFERWRAHDPRHHVPLSWIRVGLDPVAERARPLARRLLAARDDAPGADHLATWLES